MKRDIFLARVIGFIPITVTAKDNNELGEIYQILKNDEEFKDPRWSFDNIKQVLEIVKVGWASEMVDNGEDL